MGPIEFPGRRRGAHQGGYSVAEPMPVLRGASVLSSQYSTQPVEDQSGATDAPVDDPAGDVWRARVVSPTEFSFFTALGGTVGTDDMLILSQPDTRRVFLLIVNPDPNNVLYVQFGSAATVSNGFPIPPNFGSLYFDVRVPQDDIHIIGTLAQSPYHLLYSNHSEW